MAIYISSKFKEGKKNTYNNQELEYGVNAFSSLDEIQSLPDDSQIVFADAKTVLNSKDLEKLNSFKNAVIYGNYEVETTDENGDVLPLAAKNTLAVTGSIESDTTVPNTENFMTVTGEDGKFNNITKNNTFTTKTVKGKVKKYEGMQSRTDTVTQTFKNDGTVTLKNSQAEYIENYKTVTLTNSSVNDVSLNNLFKKIQSIFIEISDDVSESSSSESYNEYKSTGVFTAKLDKNADRENEYAINSISGYSKVVIAGYVDKKMQKTIFLTKSMKISQVETTQMIICSIIPPSLPAPLT